MTTRKDWFKKKIEYLNTPQLRGRAAGAGRMRVVRWWWDKDTFELCTLYGYNMLSIKPGNDDEEFYQTMERVGYEMGRPQSPPRTL